VIDEARAAIDHAAIGITQDAFDRIGRSGARQQRSPVVSRRAVGQVIDVQFDGTVR
jgi:hypothetical protein